MGEQDELSGRIAVITGSSRGIGRAVAARLVALGAAVVINGRDPDVVAEAVDDLSAAGGDVSGVAGSPADPEVADRLIGAAIDHGNRFDILVNCAGAAEPIGSSILNVSSSDWTELIDSHLTTTFQTCRLAAPHFVGLGGGAIVNTSSHAYLGIYGGTGYAAGKGAVNSLTAAIAAELREHGVRANMVCPGATTRLSTGDEFHSHLRELHERGLLDELMLAGSKDPGSPDHVASMYAFLVSERSSTITGETFVAAGGYVGRFPRPVDEFITWRDHSTTAPYTVDELSALLVPTDGSTSGSTEGSTA